jgi:serine/threonine protein phosphatase PrpC
MPAALLMAVSLASFRSIVAQGLSPGALLAYLDDALVHYTRTTRQNCAMVYMEITTIDRDEAAHAAQETETAQTIACTRTALTSKDAEAAQTVDLDEKAIEQLAPASCFSATLRVANAGCISPLIKRADGSIEWVEVGGMPLGVGMGSTFGYEEVSLDIAKGDMIILVSDGVVEANNAAGDMFGFERLDQVVENGPHTNALALLAHIRQALEDFVGAVEPHDDVTIVVTRV